MNVVTVFIIAIVLIAGYLTIAPELSRFGINVPGVSTSTTTISTTDKPKTSTPKVSVNKPKIEPTPQIKEIIPPYGFTLEQLSPFYEMATLKNINAPSATNDTSAFTIIASRYLKEPLSLNGWKVRGNAGGQVTIPYAVDDYSPYGGNKEIPIEYTGVPIFENGEMHPVVSDEEHRKGFGTVALFDRSN